MMLRARNLFLAWLAYGALQLALLGVPGAAVQPGVGNRGAQSRSESQSVALGKRLLAPDLSDRRAQTTPFAPSVLVRLDLPIQVGRREPVIATTITPRQDDAFLLPPARAPPTLS
jgi:hypothetical protein